MTTTATAQQDYTPSGRIKWYRTPIERDRMKQLIKRSDIKGLCQALPHYLLIACTGSAAYWAFLHQHWVLMAVALFCHGSAVQFLGLGGAGHELCHKSVFKSPWLNMLFLRLSSFFGWFNYPWFIASHVRHHQYTLHQPDDLEVVLPGQFHWKSLIYSVFYPLGLLHAVKYHIRIVRGRFEGEWEQRLTRDDPQLRHDMKVWSAAILLGHLALAITFILTGHWFLIVLTSLAVTYGGTINFLISVPQHIGLVDRVPDFRLCCRTFIANPVFNWLYWKMNYHTEHHMFPGVPCYNLHRLRKEIEHDMPAANRSLWATWKEIAMIVSRQKADPSYQYVQPLPPTATPAQLGSPSIESVSPSPSTPRQPLDNASLS